MKDKNVKIMLTKISSFTVCDYNNIGSRSTWSSDYCVVDNTNTVDWKMTAIRHNCDFD